MPVVTKKGKKAGTKTNGAKPKAKAAAPASLGGQASRPVVYEAPHCEEHYGDNAITAEVAQQYLGWEEEGEKTFGSEFLLKVGDTKVRCHNNTTNRPFDLANCLMYRQEILRKRWRLNGETIIIGKTGQILDGQHTLCALVLAVHEWRENPEKYAEFWDSEPVLEKFVILGIDESDDVVNTINTGKTRSLSDVIARSEFFANMPRKERVEISKVAEKAIQTVWYRTGVENAFGLRRNHSESLAFLSLHPTLLEAVKHIYEENAKKGINIYIGPGYAAGLLYLMAACASDGSKYWRGDSSPSESNLDLSNWDRACDFFVELAQRSTDMDAIREALSRISDDEDDRPVSLDEKAGVLCKAWLLYLDGATITADKLTLKYELYEDGVQKLVEFPTVGGVDLGKAKRPELVIEPDVIDVVDPKNATPTKQQRKALKSTNGKDSKPVRAAIKPVVGWRVRVTESDGDSWEGTVVETGPNSCRVKSLDGRIYGCANSQLTRLKG